MSEQDLSSGYDPAHEFFLGEKPDNPLMRDSASMWISDDKGRFGFPRLTIEAVSSEWDNRGVEANIAFPDGRVLIGSGGYAPAPVKFVDGNAVTLNAGPLTFEVREPLKRWALVFDGQTYETTVQQQAQGVTTGTPRDVRIEVEATMVVPAWSPGEQARDAATVQAVGAVGGHRHEQLFRCTGSFHIAGEAPLKFTGSGLFVRRSGARDIGEFPGHCWQSAVFPSGKAFGLMGFPPRKDGTPSFGEAYIYDGKQKHYAKVFEAPWMNQFVPHDGPVDIVLEVAGQPVRISGRTHDSTCIRENNPMFGNWTQAGQPVLVGLPFHQGGVRYEWDGEVTYGMIERSLPGAKMV